MEQALRTFNYVLEHPDGTMSLATGSMRMVDMLRRSVDGIRTGFLGVESSPLPPQLPGPVPVRTVAFVDAIVRSLEPRQRLRPAQLRRVTRSQYTRRQRNGR